MSEREEAKRDGARLQRNSGRGPIAKGDARWRDYVIDYKEYSKSFSVNKDMWGKVCTDTFAVNLSANPCIKLILGDTDRVRLAIIEWARLEELEQRIEELEEQLDGR